MKLDPGFANHWKTERLIADLGAEGVVAVLRLWGNAQIRREFTGLHFTPKRLAMETKWKGDENHLFQVFTDPDAPWLDKDDDGTFSIHGFSEHQFQIVQLWSNGKKGGRPRKVSLNSSQEENKEVPSSSPICEPNGNQMVFEAKPLCTIEQAKSFAAIAGMSETEAETWWNARSANGWRKGTSGGGTVKIGSFQSDMKQSVGWVREHIAKNGTNGKKPWKPPY